MSSEARQLAVERAPAEEHLPVLQRRAALLARDPSADEDRSPQLTLVLFTLAGERFGISASAVLRVLTLRELTPLPGAAPPLFGVTHWRGDVLTLLDLRPLLGLSTAGLTDMSRVIVMDGEDREFGVVADRVSDIVEVPENRIRPLPGGGEEEGSTLLRGITAEQLFVMDADAVLSRFGRIRRSRGT
jgi:purine-binding chemotaxis protein CheW